MFFFGLFIFIVLFSYVYYSFLMVLLCFEFLILFIYFYLCFMISLSYYYFGLIMVFACFMVMEAIMGLNLLVMNYRCYGSNFFSMW